MKQRVLTGLVLLALAGLPAAGLAQSQTVPIPHFTNKQLDAIAKAQNAAHPERWGPPPPQSSVPQPVITPLKGLWVCKSAPAGTPIYASPSTSARVVGRSIGWVAEGTAGRHGFDRVLVRRGLTGYIEASKVTAFHDKLAPAATCQIKGTEPNGMVGYFIQ